MRIRTIKPEFFTHEGLFDLERETHLPVRVAFAGLWCAADREGRFKWEPRRLGVSILPYDDVDFSRVLHALLTRAFIVRYRVGEAWFGAIPSWKKHQIINNRETSSIIPELSTAEEVDACVTREARVDDACHKEGKGKEGKGKEGADAPSLFPDEKKTTEPPRVFVPPSPDEVTRYSTAIGYPLNGQAWCDSYAQKGWTVGKSKMKDWQAAVRNWKAQRWTVGADTVAQSKPVIDRIPEGFEIGPRGLLQRKQPLGTPVAQNQVIA